MRQECCVCSPVSGACAWDTCMAEVLWEKALSTARPPSVSVGAEAYITAWGLGYIMWPATEVGTDDVMIVAGRLTVAKRMDRANDGKNQIKGSGESKTMTRHWIDFTPCTSELLTQGGSVAQTAQADPSPSTPHSQTEVYYTKSIISNFLEIFFFTLVLWFFHFYFLRFSIKDFIIQHLSLMTMNSPLCISPL